MSFFVLVDWKFVAALGISAVGIILATKVTADAAENVLIHAVDASEGLAIVD